MDNTYHYMCQIDFQHHLTGDWSGIPVYTSVESLKAHRPCWEDCGIVKVSVVFEELVLEGKDNDGDFEEP